VCVSEIYTVVSLIVRNVLIYGDIVLLFLYNILIFSFKSVKVK
jgi:hypothetical protein